MGNSILCNINCVIWSNDFNGCYTPQKEIAEFYKNRGGCLINIKYILLLLL